MMSSFQFYLLKIKIYDRIKMFMMYPQTDGMGANPNLMVPKEATLYFTINGKSFARYISI